MINTLAIVKGHLRLFPVDDTTEDNLLLLYMQAAQDYIANYLDTEAYTVNPSVKAAHLLLVGGMYENRESENVDEIKENPAVVRLLFPYRKNMGV